MKASVKAKRGRAPRRDRFAELSEGMTALAEARRGKRTLRTHAAEFKPQPEVTPRDFVRVRQYLKLSRALVCRLPSHQCAHAGELGARAGQAECSGGLADRSGEAFPGHGRAARRHLKSRLSGGRVGRRALLTACPPSSALPGLFGVPQRFRPDSKL